MHSCIVEGDPTIFNLTNFGALSDIHTYNTREFQDVTLKNIDANAAGK